MTSKLLFGKYCLQMLYTCLTLCCSLLKHAKLLCLHAPGRQMFLACGSTVHACANIWHFFISSQVAGMSPVRSPRTGDEYICDYGTKSFESPLKPFESDRTADCAPVFFTLVRKIFQSSDKPSTRAWFSLQTVSLLRSEAAVSQIREVYLTYIGAQGTFVMYGGKHCFSCQYRPDCPSVKLLPPNKTAELQCESRLHRGQPCCFHHSVFFYNNPWLQWLCRRCL